MLALPDYIVLDFLEWISQNYPRKKMLLDVLLNDEKLAIRYAREYLAQENKSYEDDGYNQCKRDLKRHINRVLDSKEFEAFLRKHCDYRCHEKDAYYCKSHCSYKCYHELEHFLCKKLEGFSRYELSGIKPYRLVDSLYYYLDTNGLEKNDSALVQLMVGCTSEDLSSILDFMYWLKEQDKEFNIYKMPETIFRDVIEEYQLCRQVRLSNKRKREIIKCFSNKSSNQMYEWINKVFGEKEGRRLSYVFERYYNNKAEYKCILLPLKGESDLNKFVKKYWYDLDVASSDWLDIFYSSKELEKTGYISIDKIKDIDVDINMLPCIVIWRQDISSARAINIWKLSHSDLCHLLLMIISCIKKKMVFDQIYMAAVKMVEDLKDENRMVQKIEQNINGTNYGAVAGINKGIVENTISPIDSNIQDDIRSAKHKISNLKELDTEMKEYLYELLDEAGISILKNDNKLKDDCVNKFKGFLVGAGKTSTAILGVLGSIASIASFFGIV